MAIGPNAVLAFGRESYRTFDINFQETLKMFLSAPFLRMALKYEFWLLASNQLRLSISKTAFMREASRLVAGGKPEDLVPGTAGNRAQLVNKKGEMVDDIVIERKGLSWHVLNAVSPGFTSSLPFADHLAQEILNQT